MIPEEGGRRARPRSVRVYDDLWAAAKDQAEVEGTTLSAVMVGALEGLAARGEARRAILEEISAA